MNEELLKTIELPEGFVIDKDKSTDTKIVIKAINEERPRCKTYEEIQRYNLSRGIEQFYVDIYGSVGSSFLNKDMRIESVYNHVPSSEIAEKIIALCQLYVIAEYYNDGWVPDWKNNSEMKYYPTYVASIDCIAVQWTSILRKGVPFFETEDLLREAYDNNKEIFKAALEI